VLGAVLGAVGSKLSFFVIISLGISFLLCSVIFVSYVQFFLVEMIMGMGVVWVVVRVWWREKLKSFYYLLYC
jgi:hypothetical protein